MTLTRNAAQALSPHRIRVNQLNVGWTLTEGEDRVKREEEGQPVELGRGRRQDTRVRPDPVAAGHRPGGGVLGLRRQRADHRERPRRGTVRHRRARDVVNAQVMPAADARPASRCSPSAGSTTSSPARATTWPGSARRRRSAAKASSTTTASCDRSTPADVDPVVGALAETGQPTSLVCFSPDFTHPDADERARQVERQKAAIDLTAAARRPSLPHAQRPALSGMTRGEGSRGRSRASRSIEYAEQRGVVLCMENHYKDGTWRYPEFAQPEDIFLEIIERIDSPAFGVQYDPSNATVGGFDPVAFLEKVKHRVVSMHASDRYLAPGATLEDLRASDGAAGILGQAEARRDRQGAQRLRRHLPHPGRRRLRRLDLDRGRHERPRRDGPLGRLPEAEARRILRRLTRRDGRAGRTCAGAP